MAFRVSTAHLKKTADGSAADSQIPGDLRFCQFVFSVERPDLSRLVGYRYWPTEGLSFGPCLRDAGFDALAEYFPFKLGEYGQHTRQGPACRRGHIKCFRQRDEADAQLGQFLQRQDEIGQRAAPAVQPPDDDRIQFASADGSKEVFPLGSLNCTRSYFSHFRNDLPSSASGIFTHRFDLQRQSLLVVCGNTRVDRYLKPTGLSLRPWPKTFPGMALRSTELAGISDSLSRLAERYCLWPLYFVSDVIRTTVFNARVFMPTVHETAYPRLKSSVSRRELIELYTPTPAEVELATRVSKGELAKLGFLILLKTFQRLGYFIALRDVPRSIIEHIGHDQGMLIVPDSMAEYDESGTRRRHVSIVRKYLRVKSFDESGQALLASSVRQAAARMEDLADIINVAIEELIRHSFELPGFTSLIKEAQRGRAEVNRLLYSRVYDTITTEGRIAIDMLLADSSNSEPRKTRWNTLKQEARSPTLTHLRELLERQQWLAREYQPIALNTLLPEVKLRQFALEAKSLDAARMQEMTPPKRYTLAATLIALQNARVLDDLAEMFIKRMLRIHRHAREALALDRLKHQERTDGLIHKLHEVIVAWGTEGNAEERLQAIGTVLAPDSRTLLEQCEAHQAQTGNNYYPYMWRFYQGHRSTLLASGTL